MIADFLLITLPEVLSAFHFIRPSVLLVLPVIALIWRQVRYAAMRSKSENKTIAPHLHEALTVGASAQRWFVPIDGVALALTLTGLAAAGPTWSRMPDPFVSPTAPVVIVLKNTKSMEADDVAPSRLERGKFKIRDLLELRAGARTALVTYAGTAHRVVPFTEDAQIMLPYLEGLTPDIMPEEGADAQSALALAVELLAEEDTPGGILYLLDDLDRQDASKVATAAPHAVVFHEILPDGENSAGLDAIEDAPVIRVTPDDSDLNQINRTLNAAYRAALLETSTQPWQDRGWMLAIPAAFLCLIWFRRGWTMKWSLVLAIGLLGAFEPRRASADGMADWFSTSDQQGQRAYNRKDFARAAELYEDPMRQGYALFRAGQYEKAVEVLSKLETADASFVQGIAHLRNRQYRDGVRAFETTLQRDPDYPGAEENLATAVEIVEFVEEAREQSDTGEEAGIGADDIVFDNEAARGAETDIDAEEGDEIGLLTADQWMNTVDTRTGDFLRQRFLLEASKGASE